MIYFYVGLGGILGSVCRYLTAVVIAPINSSVFPFETLAVNLIGCFTLSFLAFLSISFWQHKENLRLAITTGFIGSFTTFSTFTLELMNLFKSGHYVLALTYMLLSLIGGLMLAWLGMRSAEHLHTKLNIVRNE